MAQTGAAVAQYYQTPNLYNPAFAGFADYAHVRAGGRLQWVGIEDAPRTYAMLADAPFRLGKQRMGGGLVVLRDTYGLYSSLQASAQVSAKRQKWGGEFSLAVQGGLYNQKYKGSQEPVDDDEIQADGTVVADKDTSKDAFDLGIGLSYSRNNWYAALSCQHLTNPLIKQTLYFQAACNIAIKNTLFEVMPSVIASTDFSSGHGIATVRMRYRRMLSAGIGYRYDEGVCAMLGAEIKNFYIGYAYEHSTSALGKASSGSHEVWVGYAFKLNLPDKTKHRHRSVRFM